jgi:2-hydroxy-6-oxonona-2,4-dienedioate hydrolase
VGRGFLAYNRIVLIFAAAPVAAPPAEPVPIAGPAIPGPEAGAPALDRLFDGAPGRTEGSLALPPLDAAPAPRARSSSRAAAALAGAAAFALPKAALAAPAAAEAWASPASDAVVGAILLGAAALIAELGLLALLRFTPPLARRIKKSMSNWTLERGLAVALLAMVGLRVGDGTCPTPRPPPRPAAVDSTPFPQNDLVVDGMRVRYIDVGGGAGKPVLLLIPGLTSRVEEFDQMTGELSKSFRVVSLDMPGSGYSDKPDRPYSLAFYEDVILHFLDELGIEKCYLAGGSLGGNLTLRLAYRSPERFPKIVSWAPGASWSPKPVVARVGHAFGSYSTFWPTVKIQSRYWYDPGFAGRDAMLKSTFNYYDEVMSPGFIRMYWDLAMEQVGTTLQDIAPEVKTPTLLVWGDRDDGGGMDEGVARLHELMPNNRLLVLPGARHALAAERPKQLSEAISEFLAPK